MDFSHILSLLGGVAFFLYGMDTMGSSLKKVAGPKLESYLWKLSSTPLKGFLLGTLVAAIIQSSSATSVMVVSFVNAGMMKLSQAICITLGSNIGTTMTGWILTLSSTGGNAALSKIFTAATIVSVFALTGILTQKASKKNSVKNIGAILLGLAVLLMSMTIISEAVSPLKESEQFRNLLLLFKNPILGVLAGTFVAAIVQSSSAGVGILQALCVTGAIPYSVCVPMILGINIGACVPVMFSMIGSSKNGKRSALSYLFTNLFSLVLIYIIYLPTVYFANIPLINQSATVQGIAILNTGIKVITCLVLLPGYKLLEKAAYALVKPTSDENEDTEEINGLTDSLLDYAPAALEKAQNAASKMLSIAQKNLMRSVALFGSFNNAEYNKIQEKESIVDKYEDKVSNFVIKISKNQLNSNQQAKLSELLSAVSDFERLSDHAVNLSVTAKEIHEKKIEFSSSVQCGVELLIKATMKIVDLAVIAFTQQIDENAKKIESLEEVINEMCKVLKSLHITQIQKGEYNVEIGFVFNDLLVNLQRVSDHCANIAFCVLHSANLDAEGHKFSENVTNSKTYQKSFEQFRDEYLLPLEFEIVE